MNVKKYVMAGASGRGLYMYAKPIVEKFKDVAELRGIYDVNTKRMDYYSEELGIQLPHYTNFNEMIKKEKPDCVIVTTVDRFHHEYIIKALKSGCDVITEKPMTIDRDKCYAILKAERETGKKVTVTFNYRYAPYVTRIKELIKEGLVGKILSIDFEWYLDTSHGADYFRRWHRQKKNSGGLLVHKSTHHFDVVNWFLEDEPDTVFAFGNRYFYGPTRKERGKRCLTCKYNNKCEFFMDITADKMNNEMYYKCEDVDKYYRDKCVFAEEIDIEDTMSVNVKYNKGAFLTYSLIAHCPYEGWRMSINGTCGRIEADEFHSGIRDNEPIREIKYFNRKINKDRRGEVITYEIPKATGGHGGGDELLLKMLFMENVPDPLKHAAGSWAGAM
jgi:predicted dehydrogenase